MGEWRADQSKSARRYVWGQTRGERDATWKDFAERLKKFPAFAAMRFEKIGSEIHVWREAHDPSGKSHWVSCFRFLDDGWGYWTVFFRTDERRWRATVIKDMPLGRALDAAAGFYFEKMKDFC